jgi:3-deoxy-D-manno-octulosonic-acid transferase
MGELQKKLPTHVGKIYYPVDGWRYVNRALNVIHPEVIVLTEAEIWPNFIWRAQKLGIPVFLINARISDKSFARYKKFDFLFRSVFAAIAGVGVENKEDAARLRELGCRPEAVEVIGNMKFDAARLGEKQPLDVPALLRQIAVPPNAKILVAGSTHSGEEAVLAGQFLRLRRRFPDLFLVIVPRHFERSRQVGKELAAHGVKFIFRNELTDKSSFTAGDVDCLLVNTTGELKYFYEHATVVFVGKSLAAEGGQNPIEPAALGKPVVFGPNMQNFKDVARSLVRGGGAVQVDDAEELEKTLGDLLADEPRCAELGRNALQVVRSNEGAVGRTVEMIVKQIDATEIRVQPARWSKAK